MIPPREKSPVLTAVNVAETAIRKILIDLQERFGCEVEQVNVDTRNFANLAVEIMVR
jgi:hypothetical protein